MHKELELGCVFCVFLVGEDNVRSRRAMEKIGGVLTEGIDNAVIDGRAIRYVVYAIDRAAFAAGPLAPPALFD